MRNEQLALSHEIRMIIWSILSQNICVQRKMIPAISNQDDCCKPTDRITFEPQTPKSEPKIYIFHDKKQNILSDPPNMHSVPPVKITYCNLLCCLYSSSLHLSRMKYVSCRVCTGTFLRQVSRVVLTVAAFKVIWVFALKSLKGVWKVEYWIEKLVLSRWVKYMHRSNPVS